MRHTLVYHWHGWPFELTLTMSPGPEPWGCTWCGATNSGLSQSCWKCGAPRS